MSQRWTGGERDYRSHMVDDYDREEKRNEERERIKEKKKKGMFKVLVSRKYGDKERIIVEGKCKDKKICSSLMWYPCRNDWDLDKPSCKHLDQEKSRWRISNVAGYELFTFENYCKKEK